MTKRTMTTMMATPRQQKVLTSPIRLEILGQFTSPGGMSIAEVAARMGRSPGSLYYHFRILEEAGILRQAGMRSGIKKGETLFEPVARSFEYPAPKSEPSLRTLLRTMSLAFRMTERDLEAAVRGDTARYEGKDRNFFATRMHCRLTKKTLVEINHHLEAILKILGRETQRKKLPPDADQYCSLTIALLPLRGREQG